MIWIFNGYRLSGGESVIDDWINQASKRARAKFEQRVRFLRDRPAAQWHPDYVHHLHDADGIFEIRFEADRTAHRPLCMFGPDHLETSDPNHRYITVLLIPIEHNNKFRPPGAIKTALNRKREIEKQQCEVTKYEPD